MTFFDGQVHMVSPVSNASNQQSVPQLIRKQDQRDEDIKAKEADRAERQARLSEEERIKAQEARKLDDDRRGVSIDVRV